MTVSDIFESAIIAQKTVWKKVGDKITKRSVEVVNSANIDRKGRYEIKDKPDGN